MKLIIKSHASEDEAYTVELNSREDLLNYAKKYSAVYKKIEAAPTLEDGVHALAQYLSRHHMDAKVVGDRGRMRDDFNVSGRDPNPEIKDLDDAARVLESEDEQVDIPEEVAIAGTTHRW